MFSNSSKLLDRYDIHKSRMNCVSNNFEKIINNSEESISGFTKFKFAEARAGCAI